MARTKQQKQEILSTYEVYLKEAKAIYFASTKINANDTVAIKKKLVGQNAKYATLKNTILNIASEKVLGTNLNITGQNCMIVCMDDVAAPAKELNELKKQDKATFVMRILDGKILDASEIENLANLESKEVLLGKLMYLINYPTTGLARALSNNIEKLLYALNAVKDTK